MKPLLLSVSLLAAVNAAPNVIADYRIRNPDITPALGRGYSLTSYDVLSTCLRFEEKTEPTYNYDYAMIETKSDGSHTTAVSAEMEASVSYGWITASIEASIDSTTTSERKSHFISTRMATERYYSSIDDTTASLTPDALALVERGDIIGFFQACGSGYIRSIRRTAELAAVFQFTSSSESSRTQAAASLSISGFVGSGSGSMSSDSTSVSSDTETKITIKAFGIGLNHDGSDTLVARNLEDYDAAVKYAFKSMMNDNVGQIHGVEVVSWMNNLQFQNAVRFKPQQSIEWITQPGALAVNMNSASTTSGTTSAPVDSASTTSGTTPAPADSASTTSGTTPAPSGPAPPANYQQPAKVRTYLTYKVAAVEAKPNADPPILAIPAHEEPLMIEAIEVKAITMINAEFITGLEAHYRKETYTTTKFRSCMSDLAALKAAGKGRVYLQDNTQFAMVTASTATTNQVTVDDAMHVVNGKNYKTRMNSLKNFVKYFYSRCASEISRHSDNGAMTKYWWDIDECQPVTGAATTAKKGDVETACLEPGMVYTAPKATTTGTGSSAATCEKQADSVHTETTMTSAYSDLFLDKYCMPMPVASGRARPKAVDTAMVRENSTETTGTT